MKELITSRGNFIVVATFYDAYDFEIVNTYTKELRFSLRRINPLTGTESSGVVNLKMSTLSCVEIIGLVSEIKLSEELSKKVVDKGELNLTFKGYMDDTNYISATDSFTSLVEKYELKDSDLIIKKL